MRSVFSQETFDIPCMYKKAIYRLATNLSLLIAVGISLTAFSSKLIVMCSPSFVVNHGKKAPWILMNNILFKKIVLAD